MKAPSIYMPLDCDADHEHLADWPIHFPLGTESNGDDDLPAELRSPEPISRISPWTVAGCCLAGALTMLFFIGIGAKLYTEFHPSCSF